MQPNPKKNIVTFMNTTLVKDNGTIFTLTFLVKDGANFGEAAVSVTAKELVWPKKAKRLPQFPFRAA